MMPQHSQTVVDYSNTAVAIVAAHINNSSSQPANPQGGHLATVQLSNQGNYMAAAQTVQGSSLSYIPQYNHHSNSTAVGSMYSPPSVLQQELPHYPPSLLTHITATNSNSSITNNNNMMTYNSQKLAVYNNIQHFGSLPQNPSRKPKNSVMSKTNLYINGLQECDTDESVRALVEGIIDPKSCKAMMSHGKCRGSGFIDCANESDAETVIQVLRNKQMPGGTRLAVKFAYENEKDDLNVYVRNLPRTSSFGNNNLEEMFKEFGQVVSVKLLQSDNQYTGTGFVRFSRADEAQKAVDNMNAKRLLLTEEDKPVICKLADKGGRRTNNNSNHTNNLLTPSIDPHTNLIESVVVLTNGSGSSQISPPSDKSHYNNNYPSHHPHHHHHHNMSSNNHPWLLSQCHQQSPDLLAQELQSLGLAHSYILPAALAYSTEDTVLQQQQQQQQLLAQLLWAHHNNNNSRMLQTYNNNQQQQQQQPLLHWPAISQQHHLGNQHSNNNLFYTTEPYQSLIYPQQQQQQYRRLPTAVAMEVANIKTVAMDNIVNCGVGVPQSSTSTMATVIDHHQQQQQSI